MFSHKRIAGHFCRTCIQKYFREYTLKTLTLGWWGVISVVATPVVLVLNLCNWLRAWSLAPVPIGAAAPVITDDVVSRLLPYSDSLIARLNAGEGLPSVSADISRQAGVTSGQVSRLLQLLVEHQQAQRDTAPAKIRTASRSRG